MRVLNGYVRLYRKLVEWGWYRDSVVKDVFLHLLMIANWKDGAYMGHAIHPGDAIIGTKQLAADLGFSRQQVRTALKKLESTGEISIFSTNRFSIVTIENWGLYQGDDSESNQQITNRQPTDNQQITNRQPHLKKERKKEGKKENNNTPKPPEGARVDLAKMEIVREVVKYLNDRTGKHYLPTTRLTQNKIIARINEGFTTEDFIRVIDVKAMEWMNTDREKYLRPETLFGTKFEGYLNQRPERRKMDPIEIARAMDEAERRNASDEGTGWSDVRQSLSGIPEHLSWDD